MMNLSKGNMYGFVTHTWNPIKGKCSHDCIYCFMKRWGQQSPIRLDQKELKTNLGKDKFIFIGSGTDMWARDVPEEWIASVLDRCREFPGNKYLFQSKNPGRFKSFYGQFTKDVVFATTIESNRDYPEVYRNAPPIIERSLGIKNHSRKDGGKVMITIEPIMKFDLEPFVGTIKEIAPAWVNVGADSKSNGVPEPTKAEIIALIEELEKFTEVHQKTNLKRLMKG